MPRQPAARPTSAGAPVGAPSSAVAPPGGDEIPDGVACHRGDLDDGGSWLAEVPARRNGVLVLYSHGFGTLTAATAPDQATRWALLAGGYALAGASYDPNGPLWAMSSAVPEQLAALAAARQIMGAPRLVLALGLSMGGLVTAQLAQRAGAGEAGGWLDGAVCAAGLLGGGVDLLNHQLDAQYALSQLLAPGLAIQLVGYRHLAEADTAARQLSTVAAEARGSEAGQARLALGCALLNLPTVGPAGVPAPAAAGAGAGAPARAAAQYDWLLTALPFVIAGRYHIERSAGGNASWNVGVDYATLLARSPYRDVVRAMYHRAGLALEADLAELTRGAAVRADAGAVAALTRTSTVTGQLGVPVLTMHTCHDELAPVEYEHRYAEQVRVAGCQRLLRQAYVDRPGHCAFVAAETLAALRAVEHRVTSGRWDRAATAGELQQAATGLAAAGPGGDPPAGAGPVGAGLAAGPPPAFVDFQPGPLVGHRVFRPGRDGS